MVKWVASSATAKKQPQRKRGERGSAAHPFNAVCLSAERRWSCCRCRSRGTEQPFLLTWAQPRAGPLLRGLRHSPTACAPLSRLTLGLQLTFSCLVATTGHVSVQRALLHPSTPVSTAHNISAGLSLRGEKGRMGKGLWGPWYCREICSSFTLSGRLSVISFRSRTKHRQFSKGRNPPAAGSSECPCGAGCFPLGSGNTFHSSRALPSASASTAVSLREADSAAGRLCRAQRTPGRRWKPAAILPLSTPLPGHQPQLDEWGASSGHPASAEGTKNNPQTQTSIFLESPRIMPRSNVICNFRFKITCRVCVDLHRKPGCHFKKTLRKPLSSGRSENIDWEDTDCDCQRLYKSSKLTGDQSGKTLEQGYRLKMTIVLRHPGWVGEPEPMTGRETAVLPSQRLIKCYRRQSQNQQFLVQESSKPWHISLVMR